MANKKPLEVTVKETVDYVYNLFLQSPNGCVFSPRSLGSNPSQVVTILVQRGIIEKKSVYTNKGIAFKYTWVAASAPTKVLYGSITQELRDKQRKWSKSFKGKKQEEPVKVEECKALEELREELNKPENKVPEVPVVNDIKEDVKPLPQSVDEKIQRVKELWREIVSLGGYMDGNGHLSIIATIQVI